MKRAAGRTALALALLASSARADPPTPASADATSTPEDGSWTVPTLHALGLMTTMRITEAIIWPEPFADPDLGRMGRSYERAFTEWPRFDSSEPAFQWDGDPWYVNGVGHALFGSELFLRARACHHDVVPALLFTAAGSTVWEYGFEANGVQPSALDLVYTPAAGLVLGEARFWAWSAARRLDDRGWRAVLTGVLDPFGELERALGTGC